MNLMQLQMAGQVLDKVKTQLYLPSEELIDWDMAAAIAFDVAGGPRLLGDPGELTDVYWDAAQVLAPMVSEYGGVQVPLSNPVCVLDRNQWALHNIQNARLVLEPIFTKYREAFHDYIHSTYPLAGWLEKAGQVSLTTEVGLLLGFLSRKVLGQYDLPFAPSKRKAGENPIFIVEPNILAVERKYDVDSANLRFWIVLHELTHAYQFTACSWLPGYFDQLVQRYLGFVETALEGLKGKVGESSRPFRWSFWSWRELLGPENRQFLGEIQALMSLLEGYSDHLMFKVGQRLPGVGSLGRVFNRRQRKFYQRLVEAALGFGVKRRQYELGERFVSSVVDSRGIGFFNQVWEDESKLPTLKEIVEPVRWVSRVSGVSP
ncbi:MAG: zinc-dependent metalloprotease [Terriglobia bacterium]